MEGELVDEEGMKGGKNIGYVELLLFHLNRISKISTTLPEKVDSSAMSMHEDEFVLSVLVAEAFLTPYIDEEYEEAREKIDNEYGEKGRLGGYIYALKLLREMMKLKRRKGLLLEESIMKAFE